MAKLTYIIELSQPPFTKVRVVLDGTDVHASHHQVHSRLVKWPHTSHDEAVATFQKVIRKYFHPSQGWMLKEKKPGVADLEPWGPPPKSAAEVEAEAALRRQRDLGWMSNGEVMVIELKRQKTRRDLEITLERAGEARALHVLMNPADEDGVGLTALLTEIELGAAPNLDEIAFDCPWEPESRASKLQLRGLGRLLEKRQLTRFYGVGTFLWPARAVQPDLEVLQLGASLMDADLVERIAKTEAPSLRTLRLALSFEYDVSAEAVGALLRIKTSQLDELTVLGLPDVPMTMEMLLASGRVLPKAVHLDGVCDDDAALLEVVTAWQKKPSAPALSFGDKVYAALAEEAITSLSEARIERFESPFNPAHRDEAARALWAKLA